MFVGLLESSYAEIDSSVKLQHKRLQSLSIYNYIYYYYLYIYNKIVLVYIINALA